MSGTITCGERLAEYGLFDDDIIEIVDDIAGQHQDTSGWDAYKEAEAIADPKVVKPKHTGPIEVWDHLPADYKDVFTFWSTAGNPLNQNMLARVLVLAKAMPETRFVAFGSPTGIRKSAGSLRLRDLPTLWQGDYTPTVEPGLAYLQSKGIPTSIQGGHSLGAEKPPIAAANAARFDHQVTHIITSDPATVKDRDHVELFKDVTSTEGDAVKNYQNAADNPMYRDAITLSDSSLPLNLHYGLYFSATNIAYWNALRKEGYERRMDKALTANPDLLAGIIWADESELALHGFMSTITENLQGKHPGRVTSMTLEGQRHAYCNDIYLHAAVFLQALKNTKRLKAAEQIPA